MRDRLLLAALKAVPASLARHLLFLLRSHPEAADAWGYHVRPIHYYQPLPDFREITPAAASRRREPPAIDFGMPAQRQWQSRLGHAFGAELQSLATAADGFDFRNGYFDGLDAAFYYAIIRDRKPRRVVEIGSGFSTRIAAHAAGKNQHEGAPVAITCIEPFPQPRLLDAQLPVTLIRERVEHLSFELFEALEANDILFIDSSHAVKFGGDVCREFLEILPRLKSGVWIHVHDIFFPHDYPAAWLIEDRHAWTEQYLLEAFLAFNHAFTPVCAAHWLWSDFADELGAAWPADIVAAGGPQGPASFWMTRVG